MGGPLQGRQSTVVHKQGIRIPGLPWPGGYFARNHGDRADLIDNFVKKLNKAAPVGVFRSDRKDLNYLSIY